MEGKKYNITHVEAVGPFEQEEWVNGNGDVFKDPPISDEDKLKNPYDFYLQIKWVAEGMGFGNLIFAKKEGKLMVDTETMSKEFCMAVLEKFLEKCAENKVG